MLRVDRDTLAVTPIGHAAADAAGGSRSRREFWQGAVPSSELEGVLVHLRAAAGGSSRTFEHRLVAPDGIERWYRTALMREGEALIAVLLDVSGPHHNEQQWREIESWLMALGETLPFDFWICDGDDRYVLQNPASVKHIGSVLGQNSSQTRQPQASREHWAKAFARALTGELVREELDYAVRGSRRNFSRVVAPVHGSDDIRGVLGLDIDITELKLTEERLRQSLDQLSQTQDALVRQRQFTALGEMSAVVAHEVRNPLGSISNALALLRKDAHLNTEHVVLCRIMEDEVRRLDLLVVSLLDFTRPISADLHARAISTVVDDALTQTLRSDLGPSRIRVVREVDETLEPIEMDVRLVNTALMNLFRNAVQAMDGEGEIRVTIDRDPAAPLDWARVRIRDNGPGIPPAVKDRLFEPFVTTRPTGSGLGLTIVRRAIREPTTAASTSTVNPGKARPA